MWSLMNSMRLLRKPSKRGEGDGLERKGSKDQLDAPEVTVKVERRESTRLGSGATKFLRSLRSGSTNTTGKEPSGIPLNQIEAENLNGSASELPCPLTPVPAPPTYARPPERSQSFQEKRHLVSGPKSGSVVLEKQVQSSVLKVKHGRAQSFACTANGGPPKNGIAVSLCPDPGAPKPAETIYENLEVIRANKGRGSFGLSSRPLPQPKGSTMTIVEKDKDRRGPRKLTKDSGYGEYMNLPPVAGTGPEPASGSSPSPNKLISSSQSLNGKVGSKGPKQPDLYGNMSTIMGRGGKAPVIKSSLKKGPPPTETSRKLRRSISEVPLERSTTLAKFQSKDSSRTLYSSISNGLSIWSAEKSGNRKGSAAALQNAYQAIDNGVPPLNTASTLPRSSSSSQFASKSNSALRHGLEISVLDSTSIKSSLSVVSSSANVQYARLPSLSPSRSTPNLLQQQQAPSLSQKRLVNNPNKIYQSPLKNPEVSKASQNLTLQRSSGSNIGPYQNYGDCFLRNNPLPAHNRQVSAPLSVSESKQRSVPFNSTPARSNESLCESPSQCATPKQSQPTQDVPTMFTNNGNQAWAQSDSMLTNGLPPAPGSPVPPERDSASLKTIRYGPGHEKYPSWPIPVTSAAQIDPAGEITKVLSGVGSSRSKSLTEETDYPKEKVPSYARPYIMKRMNPAYTQQLKTVVENPADSFDKVSATKRNGCIVPPPLGYRDLGYHTNPNDFSKSSDNNDDLRSPASDKEYGLSSPPERDILDPTKSLSQDDLELYAKKYEERMSHYAHSEGYHSYISSECSSYIGSGTPFLDQLRRESESNQPFWPGDDPNDPLFGMNHLTPSGRESVTTVVTNSSSNSSGTETLKWHGSSSELKPSGGPGLSTNSRLWEQKLQQSIAHSAKISQFPRISHPDSTRASQAQSKEVRQIKAKPDPSPGGESPNLKKFPLSTYTRPSSLSLSGEPNDSHSVRASFRKGNPAKAPGSSATSPIQVSPIIDTSKPPSVAERILELEHQAHSSSHSSSSSSANSSPKVSLGNVVPSPSHNPFTEKFVKSSSLTNLREQNKAQPQHPPSSQSSQYKEGQGFWNGYACPSTPEIHHQPNSPIPPPLSYTYLDPEKKHRVADLTLKAIQKKALLAYYERHTGKAGGGGDTSSSSSSSILSTSPKKDGSCNSSGKSQSNSSTVSSLNSLEKELGFEPSKDPHHPQQGYPQVLRRDSLDLHVGRPSSHSATAMTSSPPRPDSPPVDQNEPNGRPSIQNSQGPHSHHEESNGKSARMAYMSKYLPHLVTRETTSSSSTMPTWSGVKSTASPSLPSFIDSGSVPPERPPKKPHLRNLSQQSPDGINDSGPPLPLPRAPVRPPQNQNSSPSGGAPPLPSKPGQSISVPRCLSPELPPPPPPPPLAEQEVDLVNDEPLPPPPSLNEVHSLMSSRTRSAAALSSYLHKDSYLAQRRERTLGYEGRYRRTLSPSGMGSKAGDETPSALPQPTSNNTPTSPAKLDSTLSPSDYWEKYHNIRPPSTTVIFTSHEIPKAEGGGQLFHRSISVDSNLFNNKTGFSQVQSSGPLPVAQVAPLRGPEPFPSGSSSSLYKCAGEPGPPPLTDAACQSSDSGREPGSVTVRVSPLRFIEGQKKAEPSFRLNCTSDASSQTDSGNEEERDLLRVEGDLALHTEPTSLSLTSSRSSSASSCTEPTLRPPSLTPSPTAYAGRQKSQEELDCEELSRDLAKQLPQGDKLQSLLVPLPDQKTSADYMEGLFHLELKLRKDQMDSATSSGTSSRNSSTSSPELPKEPCPGPDPPSRLPPPTATTLPKRCNGHAPLPADSAYFTTSECKAKFLTQYVKDMHSESISQTDSQELNKQKEVLVSRISRKLEILRIEQSEIREEIESNEQLGQIVIERVKETAKRNEFDKFKLHVEEIEKITSLLLGLSGRLARTENALMGLAETPNPQEKKILESKRDKLKEQLEEAKVLKENIDRRSTQVSGFLQKYLTVEEYADYHHFTKMKAKLIIDAREIDDKIKLGDEQMLALQETLSSVSSS